MSELERVLSRLAAGALAASLTACGGNPAGPSPGPSPTPVPQPTPQVISQMTGISLRVEYAFGVYFDTSAAGTIEATVDYTYADTILGVWVANGRCTGEQFEAQQCQLLASSFSGGKPRKLSLATQAAGSYTLIAGNAGPRDESVSFQVVFTRSATAGSPPAASSRLPLERGFEARMP